MIYRFFHADRGVGDAVKRAVQSSPRLMLVTQLKGPRDLGLETRTPFREILSTVGDWLDLVVLIDEGKPEGMWRDPMGDLCDSLFSNGRDAAAAVSGYVLAQQGKVLASFRKAVWDPLEDAETITAELAQRVPGLEPFVRPPPVQQAPDPRPQKPRPARTKTPVMTPAAGADPRRAARTQEVPAARFDADDDDPTPVPPRPPGYATDDDDPTPVPPRPGAAADDEATPVPPRPPPPAPPPEPPPVDPYRVLGIAPGVTHEEAKKAWRALLMQYHPDKVAHLGPEFRDLAEQKTRDINSAWAQIEAALK